MRDKNMIKTLSFVYLITIVECAFIHPAAKETYNVLLQLSKGEFTVPLIVRGQILEKHQLLNFGEQMANSQI